MATELEAIVEQISGMRESLAGKDPASACIASALLNVLETVTGWRTKRPARGLLPILSIEEACNDILDAIERAVLEGAHDH